jgi:uncharacterized repeat protein (TIGR03803 family)
MHTAKRLSLRKPSISNVACIVLVFCAATAIAAPAQTFSTLVSFDYTDGAVPLGGLVQANDGNFYGTTWGGGSAGPYNCGDNYSCGTVFKISTTGTLTSLYSFCVSLPCLTGGAPYAALMQASDRNFYGTASQGGNLDFGTVFKMTNSGMVTALHSFNDTDGAAPLGALIQGTDGNLYGTTVGVTTEGHTTYGTVFKITTAGVFTLLYTFSASGPDGCGPSGLVQGTDGNFYGTAAGGACGQQFGTIFKITPSDTLPWPLTTLYSFCSQPNCADGANPQGGLVQGTDGNFYGTTEQGGPEGQYGNGTVFKVSGSGTLTTLYSFCARTNCVDGAAPEGQLVQATDGNFYGTTDGGGSGQAGTIFKITPGETLPWPLTTLYSFCSQPNCADGANPFAGLVQATDGNLYGTTYEGGNYSCLPYYPDCGTVFKLSVGLGPFLKLQPTSGVVGAPVTILGTNLTGATRVTFNGTQATNFQIVSPSEITTNVPSGATTGVVQVTIPGGTLTSNTDFQVMGPIQFVSVTPCRLIDTRQTGGPIQGGTSRNFTVPQLGNCGIPTSAAAYSLNVTAVPHGGLGYLTIWPDGEIQPYVSTMNSPDGRIKANAAIVPAGNNAVSVYASNTTDVILDIDGYFTSASSQTYEFYPLMPCRIVDTRNNQDGGMLQAGVERDYSIPGNCGVPSSATAYSFNVTVLPSPGGLDYLTVWPKGETRPVVSTLNDNTGTVVANAAIVPAGSENATAFYAHSNSTNLLIDVDGYFAAPGTGGFSLYPVAPCRVLDTRQNNGQPFSGEKTVNVVGSACAPPSNAAAYIFNATVVPPGRMPYLTLWPDGEQQPVVSTLNALDGFITSNMAIVPTNNGSIDAYAAGLTQLILDISGYFAP